MAQQKMTTRQYLEHHFLSALTLISMSEFFEAQAELEIILTTPTQQSAVSQIQVEAYKRWLLIHLLFGPSIPTDLPIPRSIHGNALKYLRALAKPYECLVEAFKSNNLAKLQAEIQEGMDVWQNDMTFGLVQEILAAFRRYAVLRLSRVFAAVPIEEVARRTSPTPSDTQETLQYITSLIATKQLQGTLESSQLGGAGTLRFTASRRPHKSEQEIAIMLKAKSAELQALLQQISDHDRTLEISPEYVEFLQKAKKARDHEKKLKEDGKSSKASGFGMGYDRPGSMPGGMLDEDMMDDW